MFFNSRLHKTLAEILSSKDTRDELLGIKKVFENDNETERDAHRIVEYAKSSGYEAWVKDAWSQVIFDMDKLTRNTLSDQESHFHRGSLSATMDLIRISHKAFLLIQETNKEKVKK